MKPKVWHLSSNRWNSAITEYALRTAQALAQLGWGSALSARPGSACEERAKGFAVAGPSFRFALSDIFALRKYARQHRPDLIITYGGPETFLARFLGVPVVRFRGQDRDLSQPLSRFDLWLSLGFCRAILTPAEVVAARFRVLLPQQAVHAVALGLDSERFHARPRTPSPGPRLLIVGRLDPIKGHEKFFMLFKALLTEWDRPQPPPYLEIIGQSANLSAATLRLMARAVGLSEGVDWGLIDARVPNLPERMAGATLGVIPSLGSEVICRVAEEFLLSGTPILATAVGSLAECLPEPGFGALLLGDGNDVSLLKHWVGQAYDEPQAVREERARRAACYFSLQKMAKNLSQVLEPLLSKDSPQPKK